MLRDTGNHSVMWGDTGLLHLIAKRAELRSQDRAWKTENAVLQALSRHPGELVARYTTVRIRGARRVVRIFHLPEHVPKEKL